MSQSAQSALRGVGLGWRSEIAPDLLRAPKTVDFVEVVAENCAVDAGVRREVLAIAELWPVVPHGVKLSLGSAEGIDVDRVRRLGRLARDLRAPLLSEHVAFTRTGGRSVGHLTTLPFTREAVDVLARNVSAARRHLPDIPLLLENVARTFAWPEDAMAEGDFLAEVVEATGCDLLLDLGNLYANAVNAGQSPRDLLRTFPLERVGMVHVAGGVNVDGFYEDTHAHPIPEPVFDLLAALFIRVGGRPVLLERDAGFGPFAALGGEVARLRRMTDAAGQATAGEPVRAPRPSLPRTLPPPGAMADLEARQVHVATLLTAAAAPSEGDARPFGPGALARTRAILLGKRVDEALPLLPRLNARGAAVRERARVVLTGHAAAPHAAGIADAMRVASVVAGEPETAADAGLDQLTLRARFRGLRGDSGCAPRRGPFLGGTRVGATFVVAFKGPGSGAPVRLVTLPIPGAGRAPRRPAPLEVTHDRYRSG